MTLKLARGAAGAPWDRPLEGRVHRLVVESELLAGNPLGDPARRPLYVYLPPGFLPEGDEEIPAIYVLQGYTGQVDMWVNRSPFQLSMFERLDALFSTGEVPPAAVVFVDAWTAYGGSQFINSTSTGPYMDYLCDEVVPFVDAHFPVAPRRESRAVTGKSSGGYGAMVVPMLRPDVFSALASHAGDSLFEYCYLPDFPKVMRTLRDGYGSSYERFLEAVRNAEVFDHDRFGVALAVYACAACWSPDEAVPGKVQLPFDLRSGALVDEVWARWLAWDPVRMAERHQKALRQLTYIYLEAGRSDEYHLDVGAQAMSSELTRLGVPHEFALFDGGHGNMQYRYPAVIRTLAERLSSS
ncbi:MAG: alpha/beta hydrolase [Candidatus Dormibacteria bacterium]